MGCADSKASVPVDSFRVKEAKVIRRSYCPAGSECGQKYAEDHRLRFCHPGDVDCCERPECRNGEDCPHRLDQGHCDVFCHPGDEDYTGARKACRYAAACKDCAPRHRRRFSHPGDADDPRPPPRKACKFGLRCFRHSDDHLREFAHPGDADYRRGLVVLEDGVVPEFDTLRQLFDYCDPAGHGNFVLKEDFAEALAILDGYREEGAPLDADRGWRDLEGARNAFVGFAKFAAWAERVGVWLPVGVDVQPASADGSGNDLSCGFVYPDGRRCSCKSFCPREQAGGSSASTAAPAAGADAGAAVVCPEVGDARELPQRLPSSFTLAPQFCKCGHKRSMHAQRGHRGGDEPVPRYWMPPSSEEAPLLGGDDGIAVQQVLLTGDVVDRFQYLLDRTHKASDNWTRDRGCALHGRHCHAKDPMCAFRNKCEVPSGYRVAGVLRNVNPELWGEYALARGAISKECESDAGRPFKVIADVQTHGVFLEEKPAIESCNEWFLFHGSSPEKCQQIMDSNFRLSLAGSGATWKDAGSSTGTPLYGHGIYFADRVTKADEYSHMVEAGQRFAGCHTMLVCRVVGGRTQYCDTNEIDAVALQKQVISGPFHSVFGDRVTRLKKPFREVVVYDATQCYPEYLVYYRRLYS
uniref:Poly [ADP-ribose] polymerase n=1 Tax=Zooxanthella nutricula TaxID=1333877 RepID=A0A6V0G0G3_9DINO